MPPIRRRSVANRNKHRRIEYARRKVASQQPVEEEPVVLQLFPFRIEREFIEHGKNFDARVNTWSTEVCDNCQRSFLELSCVGNRFV